MSGIGKRDKPWDLAAIANGLNERYFKHQPIRARITWSRSKRNDLPESIHAGAWCHRPKRRIVIHRALQYLAVPDCVIEWLIWHEMGHLLYGRGGGEDTEDGWHHDRFCAFERAYEQYPQAIQWWDYHQEKVKW